MDGDDLLSTRADQSSKSYSSLIGRGCVKIKVDRQAHRKMSVNASGWFVTRVGGERATHSMLSEEETIILPPSISTDRQVENEHGIPRADFLWHPQSSYSNENSSTMMTFPLHERYSCQISRVFAERTMLFIECIFFEQSKEQEKLLREGHMKRMWLCIQCTEVRVVDDDLR